jgi:DNA polymerase III subunit beta
MKITVLRSDLIQGLERAAEFLPTRNTLPILSTILIEATSEGLRLVGTDLDTSCRARVRAAVDTEGSCCVPGKQLLELTKRSSDEQVHLQSKEAAMAFKCGNVRSSLRVMPAEEYPLWQDVDAGKGFGVDVALLRAISDAVVPFASSEASRAILNGVCWNQAGFYATDSHRLSRYKVETPVPTELILLPKLISAAARILGGSVHVRASNRLIRFDDGDTELTGRIIEGPYPNAEQVMGRGDGGLLSAPIAQLEPMLRRVELFASGEAKAFAIACTSDGEHEFSAKGEETGSHSERFQAEYVGDDSWIALSLRYQVSILAAMKKVGAKTVAFQFYKTDNRAVTIESPDVPQLTYVLMPLRKLALEEPEVIRERLQPA